MISDAIKLDRLLTAVQELSLAPDLPTVQEVVRRAARDLADCDGATFVLRDGEQCYYADEDAIEPLWKGSRFPLTACISGWAMLNREHVVIPDIYVDDRIPHEAYRPTFVKSLAMMPVRTLDPIAAIGAYWADHHTATDEEVALLQGLANATSVALDKLGVHAELANEVALREASDQQANTDELTKLWNRRGFFAESRPRWAELHRSARATGGAVAFVDVNGLKIVNDTDGHHAGDAVICRMAAALTEALRSEDVVARIGGDEFAVFAPRMTPEDLQERLTAAVRRRASVGTAPLIDIDLLADALLAADAEMYGAKRRTMRTA